MSLKQLSYLISGNLWIPALVIFFLIAYRSMRKRQAMNKMAKRKWKDTVAKKLHEPLTLHPEIDPALCAGCGACVRACPEGDIIKLVNHKAVLIEPSKCVGHGECAASCPFDAIHLAFGTKTRGMDLPMVDGNYQTNIPGLYISGELGGMGLIRNAVKQGRLAAEHATANLKPDVKADFDIIVVGAGPAGLSASLACTAAKKRYVCIEQNKFGGTIFNFPRQKVVMSKPFEFPLFGKFKFPQHKVTKEDILGLWRHLRKKAKLRIKEETRFETLTKNGDVFTAVTSKGRLTSQKVILSMGVRGTPRKLGIPGENLSKVTYNLLDPEQYQGRKIAIVGGGNAAVEAARQLAQPLLGNLVHLFVRSARFTRCNEENERMILDYQRQKRVKISFDTVVEEIHQTHLVINHKGQLQRVDNDFVFIFAGAVLPFDFLRSIGIMIETKFGETLKNAK
jgi:thioredoxin reductase/NAD-dependent dihydropyrimidine dehydrogenase PreA subunit